ncbi:hypothetical protein [Brevundimonas variabilis]|uniref:YARHG domain-containing protein n=1 Tax=Brevundimonas variabilis TaxID=74312 RepID=A0A7W9FDD3_9CAUL|nr:hypothetical protein [Brevundimonas variabilis]MBB5745105.1 hypothetical protein [Brevundimonas variabilis]
MIRTILLAMTATTLLAGSALAGQTPTTQPDVPAPMDIPVLGNAQVSTDCGNLYQMAGRAYCLTAPLAGIGTLADTYSEHFRSQGWLAAAGEENRVVFVKRREGGGCDGLQMVAFYDTARPAGPEAAGYLGFATIPGNVCAAAGAAATPTP